MKYRIFTEGDCDKNFIIDFLKHILQEQYDNLDISFRKTGGYTNLEESKPQFDEISDVGGKNIVIFDADFVRTGGGAQARRSYLMTEKERLGIQFELFLFPDNANEGIFEDLLSSIVPENKQPVVNCFDSYERCIRQLNLQNPELSYNTPDKKSKIYAYVETLSSPNAFEKARKAYNMFYANSTYWNLDSENIRVLRNFLTAQIVP